MKRPSPQLLARIGAGLLLLIIIRTLSEVLRLEYLRGDALTVDEVRPFIVGGLVAAVALAVALLANLAERPRLSLAVALVTIPALFVYKVFIAG